MGALLAAGGETSPEEAAGAKALCGLCGLLEESEMSLQRCLAMYYGRVY